MPDITNVTSPEFLRIDALAIEDALAVSASPGSLLLELLDTDVLEVGNRHPLHAHAKVLAAGPRELVDRHPAAANARVLSRPGDVLIPGLINAHCHLDLTHIGPRPYVEADGFVGFVDLIRKYRHSDDEKIAESVRLGIESSLLSGVVAVGDIAGAAHAQPRLSPFEELVKSPLWGVSFVEFFAIGNGEEGGMSRLEEALDEGVRRLRGRRMQLGISPHAPSTVSRRAYMKAAELAARHGLPLMTHLSETPEERDFIAAASGPQRGLLQKLGIWDDAMLREIGHGKSPINHLGPILRYGNVIAVHTNFASDEDIGVLLDSRTSVVFCPRASAYFKTETHFGPHRYRDFGFCGIKVALGTDSVINLWREGMSEGGEPDPRYPRAGAAPLSILEEMRLLYRRDAVRAITLLGMATMDAAAILGMDPLAFTFKRGSEIAGVVAVSAQKPGVAKLDIAVDRIMLGNALPELLLIGK